MLACIDVFMQRAAHFYFTHSNARRRAWWFRVLFSMFLCSDEMMKLLYQIVKWLVILDIATVYDILELFICDYIFDKFNRYLSL